VGVYQFLSGNYFWLIVTRSPIFNFSPAELLIIIRVWPFCAFSFSSMPTQLGNPNHPTELLAHYFLSFITLGFGSWASGGGWWDGSTRICCVCWSLSNVGVPEKYKSPSLSQMNQALWPAARYIYYLEGEMLSPDDDAEKALVRVHQYDSIFE